MSLRRYLSKNPKVEADQSSLGNDRTPSYTSNATTAPYTLSDRDSMRQPGSSLTGTLSVAEKSKVATTNYGKRSSGFFPILICVNFVY